ncbi:MAG: hypothetical protein J3K34DRAFT_81916 [Monoraphidium minutum]|nr:MAG: hypothetical protein J3K34DRAFT_81916 [Monoraphidium minutum]
MPWDHFWEALSAVPGAPHRTLPTFVRVHLAPAGARGHSRGARTPRRPPLRSARAPCSQVPGPAAEGRPPVCPCSAPRPAPESYIRKSPLFPLPALYVRTYGIPSPVCGSLLQNRPAATAAPAATAEALGVCVCAALFPRFPLPPAHPSGGGCTRASADAGRRQQLPPSRAPALRLPRAQSRDRLSAPVAPLPSLTPATRGA